jgi:hypothetical protein
MQRAKENLTMKSEGDQPASADSSNNTVSSSDANSNAAASSASGGIILPSRNDVLFGRGRPMREHPGNLRLHFFIEERMEEYEAANKREKTNIASDVVVSMKAKGIRFLKKEKDMWVEVDDEVGACILHT